MGRLKIYKDVWIPFQERDEWGAAPEKLHRTHMLTELPLTHVRFSYDDLLNKYDKYEHLKALQKCQKVHMEDEGYEDIKYNFMISSEGVVYEGRGWDTDAVRPAKYADIIYKCLDIVYIGDYSNVDPPWPAVRSAMFLLMWALRNYYLHCSYKVIPLRDPID